MSRLELIINTIFILDLIFSKVFSWDDFNQSTSATIRFSRMAYRRARCWSWWTGAAAAVVVVIKRRFGFWLPIISGHDKNGHEGGIESSLKFSEDRARCWSPLKNDIQGVNREGPSLGPMLRFQMRKRLYPFNFRRMIIKQKGHSASRHSYKHLEE